MSPLLSLPSLVDYLLELLQSFAGRFSSRLAHAISLLRENQVAASVAAVAGFAASIIIIWRLGGGGGGRGSARGGGRGGSSSRGETSGGSRVAGGSSPSSSASQREEDERRRLVSGKRDDDGSSAAGPSAAAATSGDAAVGQSSGVATSLTRAVLRGSASQPTPQASALAGSVRRQLAGARKVTCHMPGVLLQQKSPQELLEGATLLPCDVCETLVELAKQCDLYLLARVDDDASEVAILSALESGGIIGPQSSVNSNKVLFCSTDVGVVSFVRQLEADLHLDSSFEVVNELKRFVKRIGFIVAPGGAVPLSGAGNVVSTPSLSAFFGTA